MKYIIFILCMNTPFLALSQTKKPKKIEPKWIRVETEKGTRNDYATYDTTYGTISVELGYNGTMQGEGYVIRSQYWQCGIYTNGYHTNGKDTIPYTTGGCSSSSQYIYFSAYIKKDGKYVRVDGKFTIIAKP